MNEIIVNETTSEVVIIIGTPTPEKIVGGITTTNGPDGRVIALGQTLDPTAYRVEWSWAEDPELGQGDVWIDYEAEQFTIFAAGIGKKIRYTAREL